MGFVRSMFRSHLRAPGFCAAAIATLAFGIGANAAVFSVVDAVLLRQLPYPEANQLVVLSAATAQPFVQFTSDRGLAVYPEELRTSPAFAHVGLAESGGLNLGNERPSRVRAARVDPEFFETLGAAPILGRVFTREDIATDRRVAVLGYGLWKRLFDEDPQVIGTTIALNNHAVLVLGVMPPRVDFPEQSEVWVSARWQWQLEGAAARPFVIARLTPNATPSFALDELNRIDDEFGALRPNREVTPLRDALVAPVRPVLMFVGWGAFLVLIVTCVNVANLLVVRWASREQEFAVRRVLGASGKRLAGQALQESLALSLAAGVVAIPLAFWTLDIIRAFIPPSHQGAGDISIDGRALAALAVLSMMTAVAVGLVPALTHTEKSSSYTRGAYGATAGIVQRRVRTILVVVQVAISIVLLACAITIRDTIRELTATDMGPRGENALVVELTLPRESYRSTDRAWRFYDRLIGDVGALPGVDVAGVTDQMPGAPLKLLPGRPINVDGTRASEPPRTAILSCASAGYFEALGIDLLAGGTLTSGAGQPADKIAVVSESFAREFDWRASEIVGHYTNAAGMARAPESREIVGVVRDVKLRGPESNFAASLYVPCAERPPFGSGYLVVKTGIDPETVVPQLRRIAAQLDPRVPLHDVRTFADIRALHTADRRLAMALTLAFGALSFGLAVIGLYGAMSHIVQLRTPELGIRLVFGATPRNVEREVLRRGLLLAAGGAAVGTALTLVFTRLAWSTVPGLTRVAPTTFFALIAVTGSVAFVASWLPARRATNIDPIRTLRAE